MNDQLWQEFFGVPPIHTRGTREGVILKYRRMYLKIYNVNLVYEINGYMFGMENPIFVDKVPFEKLSQYGHDIQQFIRTF